MPNLLFVTLMDTYAINSSWTRRFCEDFCSSTERVVRVCTLRWDIADSLEKLIASVNVPTGRAHSITRLLNSVLTMLVMLCV